MTSVPALHKDRKNHIEHSRLHKESLKRKDTFKLTILGMPLTLLLYQLENVNALFSFFFFQWPYLMTKPSVALTEENSKSHSSNMPCAVA